MHQQTHRLFSNCCSCYGTCYRSYSRTTTAGTVHRHCKSSINQKDTYIACRQRFAQGVHHLFLMCYVFNFPWTATEGNSTHLISQSYSQTKQQNSSNSSPLLAIQSINHPIIWPTNQPEGKIEHQFSTWCCSFTMTTYYFSTQG